MKNLINRPKYYFRIRPFMGKPLIKVLIGQRRVGKSYLLRQLQEEISNSAAHHCIAIDKENDDFAHIATAADLSAYVKANTMTTADVMNVLMVDEVQEITDFENSIRHFAAQPNFDVYLTGSNSALFSSELSTRLGGRYIEIPVYSLDYKEFLTFHGLEQHSDSLNMFLKYGGMPFLRHLQLQDNLIFEYLKNVFDSILYRDLITRHNIRNVNFLDRLIHFVADNIGSILNASKISSYLKSQRIQISVNTVLDYLSHLASSQIIVPVKRIDLKGKRTFEVGEKYYFQDLGIRNALAGYRITDMGKIMENCVFHHLLSHGYKVFTGDWQQKEIDFVAEKNNERTYIQVASQLTEQATIEREFGNLNLIQDHYQKIVVSMDASEGNTFNGIQHWSLRRFLEEFE
jgi:uncharacterized protein